MDIQIEILAELYRRRVSKQDSELTLKTWAEQNEKNLDEVSTAFEQLKERKLAKLKFLGGVIEITDMGMTYIERLDLPHKDLQDQQRIVREFILRQLMIARDEKGSESYQDLNRLHEGSEFTSKDVITNIHMLRRAELIELRGNGLVRLTDAGVNIAKAQLL